VAGRRTSSASSALSVAALDGDQVGVGTTEDLLILRFADVASSDRSSHFPVSLMPEDPIVG
jgi:hypothetical protein